MNHAAELEHPEATWSGEVWRVLSEVKDPEIPILSIIDLGIVRYVRGASRDALRVGLTPTYSGCPATDVIKRSVEQTLARAGFGGAIVETVLAPPWSSDWITPAAREPDQLAANFASGELRPSDTRIIAYTTPSALTSVQLIVPW